MAWLTQRCVVLVALLRMTAVVAQAVVLVTVLLLLLLLLVSRLASGEPGTARLPVLPGAPLLQALQ